MPRINLRHGGQRRPYIRVLRFISGTGRKARSGHSLARFCPANAVASRQADVSPVTPFRMQFFFDMVHHNPGEAPFSTAFNDPQHLARYGCNGQVFKHLNCVATYAATGVDVFPAGSPARLWLGQRLEGIEREIAAAKAAGLQVFYHLDLFVLPVELVRHFHAEITDERGRISLDRTQTLELHRIMFRELAARFPQVDGYIIRVGETYLQDTPHHTGNAAVPQGGRNWRADYHYAEMLRGEPAATGWSTAQAAGYVKLLQFLRDEVCVHLGKYVFFRTWDVFPDRLHARLDHYRAVTDRIEPHPRLLFSIKHTALDFWRRVKPNDCIGEGRHAQVIEVQCQREYEGKGAYPNYFMDRLIDGFAEDRPARGLREMVAHPLVRGLYSWSRGGGWHGPYLPHELWPDLAMGVLGRFARDPSRPEHEHFAAYAREQLGLAPADAARFRELCCLSSEAVLKGRYCEVFDEQLRGELLPTVNWMRDDRLGGREQLRPLLLHLWQQRRLETALREKDEAVALWQRIEKLAEDIAWPEARTGEFVRTSAAYGRLLFSIARDGWRVLAAGIAGEQTGEWDFAGITVAAQDYRRHWTEYRTLASSALCPSLYHGYYLSLAHEPEIPGLDESVDYYLQCATNSSAR